MTINNDHTQLGLALEGGGAKGAYHMGAVKAYAEAGYTFGAVAGTSIGALNGAVIAQNRFEAGYRLWEQMEATSIFDIDEASYRQLQQKKLDGSTLRQLAFETKKLWANRGMDTSKIRQLIATVVDEAQLRQSSTDFGLVTVSLTDRQPMELYKEDIPDGQLIDYLIASASFPGFQPAKIDDKYFIDGGLYDNCPVNMLARKGYRRIIAIRTLGLGFTRPLQYSDVEVVELIPSENLGGMMNFSPELIRRNLQMGYYDALRQLTPLYGEKYCFLPQALSETDCRRNLAKLSEEGSAALARMLGLGESYPGPENASWSEGGARAVDGASPDEDAAPSVLWSNRIAPRLCELLRLSPDASTSDVVVRLAEGLAEAKGIPRYAVYSFSEFVRSLVAGPLTASARLSVRQVTVCMAAQRIFEQIDWD